LKILKIIPLKNWNILKMKNIVKYPLQSKMRTLEKIFWLLQDFFEAKVTNFNISNLNFQEIPTK
jgi:hypothetical protein